MPQLRLQHKQWLAGAMIVACCLALGGTYFFQSLDAFQRVNASLREVERFNAVTTALNAISAERGPGNVAMTNSESMAEGRTLLSAARTETDHLLARAERAVVGSKEEAELLSTLDEGRSRLVRARRLIDEMLAIKPPERSNADIAVAMDAMFMAFESTEFARDRLGQTVVSLEPGLSSAIYLAIATSTFRDQVGRLGAFTLARLRTGSEIDQRRDQRFYSTIGRLLTIRENIRNFAVAAKFDRTVEAIIWRVDHELYSVAIPRTSLIYRESQLGPTMTARTFADVIRSDLQKIQQLRMTLESWSEARLVAMRDSALYGVLLSAMLTVLGTLIVVAMSLALRRLLFAPLMTAREQIVSMANGDLSDPEVMDHQSPEMREMFQGLESLRDEQRFRRQLEESQRQMADDLKRLSETDMLTGLLNRRALERIAVAKLRKAEERVEPIGLILFDIDHFKMINDGCGHATGDAVLQAVAVALGACLPEDSAFARFGGEEFVVLLDGTFAKEASPIADRLRLALKQMSLSCAPDLSVTASFGVAVREPQSDLDFEGMLTIADRRLYAAKRAGRDQVCFSDHPTDRHVGGLGPSALQSLTA